MNVVAILQQQLGKICTILARYPSNKRLLLSHDAICFRLVNGYALSERDQLGLAFGYSRS